jgi:hypothetical protein
LATGPRFYHWAKAKSKKRYGARAVGRSRLKAAELLLPTDSSLLAPGPGEQEGKRREKSHKKRASNAKSNGWLANV